MNITDFELPGAVVYLIRMEPIEGLYERLVRTVAWKQQSVTIYGRRVPQPRLVAWFGEEGLDYRYSGTTNSPQRWTSDLLEAKEAVEGVTGTEFNSVLLNLYRDGQDSIGFHCDDEPELGPTPLIASLSLGGERTFVFRHKARSYGDVKIALADHDLLLMAGDTQKNWQHGIDKVARADPRINLTFRTIVPTTAT